ncbi:hypothetical protein B0T24DRAFT_305660 [Lasiosphaeria ovina]|uniref:Peptidase S1 domain-containing protein n=1 Tax=Lasiosphaeria ovina TaxID=92902 RepID=A0AAE0N570_9PEZI|nr:hypothetical protein B0T24DRAFT_305660 [Lasiosphaeria ovina]
MDTKLAVENGGRQDTWSANEKGLEIDLEHVLFANALSKRKRFPLRLILRLPLSWISWAKRLLQYLVGQSRKRSPVTIQLESSPVPFVHRPKATAFRLQAARSRREPEGKADDKISREAVSSHDVQPGGDSRAVVSVKVIFESGDKAAEILGTGFAIDLSTVAVAGHLVAPDDPNYGRALQVIVQAGEPGNGAETRRGEYVAVHSNWISNQSEEHDIAFIRLVNPFKDLKPIKCEALQKPVADNKNTDACVYGYTHCNEIGVPSHINSSKLWKSRAPYTFSDDGFVLHKGDTDRGTSGGPVILVDKGVAFAIHTGFSISDSVNFAVPFDFDNHNPTMFREVLEYMAQRDRPGGRCDPAVEAGKDEHVRMVARSLDGIFTTYTWDGREISAE